MAMSELREAVESAYAKAGEGEEPEESAGEEVSEHGEGEGAGAGAGTEGAGSGEDGEGEGRESSEEGEEERDDSTAEAEDDGSSGDNGEGEAGDREPATDSEQRDDVNGERAPQSWKPAARESWKSVPKAVRAEIHRRVREIEKAFQDTAQSRQVGEQLAALQQQYAPALAAEGVDVLTATNNLMSVASRLRFGTPVEKAQLAAKLVSDYGVDIDALGAALSVVPQGGAQSNQPPVYRDPRLDQLLGEIEASKKAHVQRVESQAVNEVTGFASGREFFDDVRNDMADLLEMAARRGQTMSMEDAYQRACQMNGEIGSVLKAREAAAANKAAKAAAKAAVSVKGAPVEGEGEEPNDIRGAIERAIRRSKR